MPMRVTGLSAGRLVVAGPLAALYLVALGVPGQSLTVPTAALSLTATAPSVNVPVARVRVLTFAPATVAAARAGGRSFPAGAPGTAITVDAGLLALGSTPPDVGGGGLLGGDGGRWRVRPRRVEPVLAEALIAVGEDAIAAAVLVFGAEELFGEGFRRE